MFAALTTPCRAPCDLIPASRRAPNPEVALASNLEFFAPARADGSTRPLRVTESLPALSAKALDDLQLLQRVCTGDHQAFESFYTRFRNLIVACASRVCQRAGVRLQADDLADLLADVTLNIVANDYRRLRLYRLDGGCSVSSWIGVIATSTAHDFLRKERRRRLDPTPDADLERIAPAVDSPDFALIDREQRQFVDDALASFSERDRCFVDLYFVQALDPDIIAARMNVSVSTVYSKKAKIKTRLCALATVAA